MARLEDKFTVSELDSLSQKLCDMQANATALELRINSNDQEIELLDTVDHLCRVANMLCNVIEADLKGHIKTSEPLNYINNKFSGAELSLENYHKQKNIKPAY